VEYVTVVFTFASVVNFYSGGWHAYALLILSVNYTVQLSGHCVCTRPHASAPGDLFEAVHSYARLL
jgi:hypothetical protein